MSQAQHCLYTVGLPQHDDYRDFELVEPYHSVTEAGQVWSAPQHVRIVYDYRYFFSTRPWIAAPSKQLFQFGDI